MADWSQDQLFAEWQMGGPQPHARMTDPVSSDLAVKSLGRDTSYNWRIFNAIMVLAERTEARHYDDGDSIAVFYDAPVVDDDIWSYMERRFGGRFQRNVIARQRGLIREAGWIERVEDIEYQGRPHVAHIPTRAGIDAWHLYLKETYGA